jgi:hypothetical protein
MATLDEGGQVGDFSAAFPATLWPEVAVVAAAIPESGVVPAAPFVVRVDRELVSIPYRIHNAEVSPDAARRLSPVQRTIMSCLYTRHDDGFVRQRHLEAIVGQAQRWVAPFVVRLLGEYVVQIVLAIRDGLADIDVSGTAMRHVYGRFAAGNPAFVALTYERAASYWDCYHRYLFPDRRAYPSFPILDSIRAAGADPGTAEQDRAPQRSS